MSQENGQSSAEKANLVKQGLKAANYVVGKGFIRKTGTGMALYGILTGDWVPVIGGLLVRLWPSITAIQEQRDTARAQAEKHEAIMAKATTKEAAEQTPLPVASKQIVHVVKQARLNVEADDPQPGDIAVLQMAEALGI